MFEIDSTTIRKTVSGATRELGKGHGGRSSFFPLRVPKRHEGKRGEGGAWWDGSAWNGVDTSKLQWEADISDMDQWTYRVSKAYLHISRRVCKITISF